MIEILTPGLQTSIQDLGRPGHEQLGISPSGAADPVSLAAGNSLLGNTRGAAALEMTLLGPTLRFVTDFHFTLAGAEFPAFLSDRLIKRWNRVNARAGETLKLGAATRGCRAYLCVAGGFDIPLVLGSASTHLQSGVGGFEGRALKKGDRLRALPPVNRPGYPIDTAAVEASIFRNTLRVTRSVHTELLGDVAWYSFLKGEYVVSQSSNRLGLRLEGVATSAKVPEVATTGVSLGTIQLSPDGKPMILFVEQQLTGGYPQLACVASRDLAAIGQLKPGDRIRFEEAA